MTSVKGSKTPVAVRQVAGAAPLNGIAALAAALPGEAPAPLRASTSSQFVTEPNSPFPDGYSIAGEREALADLLESDEPDEADPRYPRLLLLDEREREFKQMQATWRLRNGAEHVVEVREAMSMRQLGSLVDEDIDRMTLHTKEGYRLFMGRARDPEGSYAQIVGGKRIASALKSLWMLTAFDNPYADWALVRHEANLTAMKQRLEEATKAGLASLQASKDRGLSYNVLKSSVPKELELGFKSPYGYAIAELVVAYDYFVRIQKTLERKNLASGEQVRQTIREVTRFIRRHFNETARFERWLLRPELKELSRADFVPGAAAEGQKRVLAATEIFGPVPAGIFSLKLTPRHSRRRDVPLTEQERKLLQSVGEELERAEAGLVAGAVDDGAAGAEHLV